jgi:hypothetical protein
MSAHGRSSDEIRREIEAKRAEMDRTIDRLEHSLSPGQLLDQALHAVRGGSSPGGNGSSFVKEHPVPLALMGAGAAWLAAEAASGKSVTIGEDDVGQGTYGRARGRVGPYRRDAVHGEIDFDDGRSTHGDRSMADRASDAKDSAASKLGSAKEKASDAADRIGHAADRARHEARHQAYRAREGVLSMLDSNPLAVGAAAFGLGLASGLAVPTTRGEDDAMGRTADTLKDEVKDMAEDAGTAVKRAGAAAASAAKDEADRQNLGGSVTEKAKRIAAEAKDAATERAREEGLSTDKMKRRADEARHRTKQQAERDARRMT